MIRKSLALAAALLALAAGQAAAQQSVILRKSDNSGPLATSTGTLPISGTLSPTVITTVECGATVVTGGTAVSINSDSSRKGGYIRNPVDATEKMFVSITGTATTTSGTPNSADLVAGEPFNFAGNGTVYQGAISINAATNGHKFECVVYH